MAMSQELTVSDDADDSGLTGLQVRALERLHELNAAPRSGPDQAWSSNPQIRSYQMIFEGLLGGKREGGGRPRTIKHQRAAAGVADHVRGKLQKRMVEALDRALEPEAGHRVNLDAVKLGLEIEAREDALVLKEAEHEDNLADQPREELLGTLFQLLENGHTATILETAFEDITDAEVVTEGSPPPPSEDGRDRASPDTSENGRDSRDVGVNGQGSASEHRRKGESPLKAAARRRAAERR